MSIEKRGRQFVVDAAGVRLTWSESRLAWRLQRGRQIWEWAAPGRDALQVRAKRDVSLSLRAAKSVETRPFASQAMEGIVCHLSRFEGLPRGARIELTLTVAVEVATGDVVASVDGDLAGLLLRQLCWPGPIVLDDASSQETVIPFMQGVLIPGNWPHEIAGKQCDAQGRELYMPWWGQRRGKAGYLAILESDADAGCRVDHPRGGPTRVRPRWDGSLGRIGYPRVIRYAFFDRADYVSFCKHYRRHVIRQGRFVSLREKIGASPKVRRLIGSPVVHTNIAHNIHPESRYYSADNPARNSVAVPFRTRMEQLKALRQKGIDRLYVHLDGWGVHGYDSHHPDYLPPNKKAGGWKGLRELADTCHDLGYLLALHDQYRDYYHNAPSFDPANAIHDAEGKVSYWAIWYGGPQSVLCTRLAPAYVLANHQALQRRGIQVDGSYLDVFAVVRPDECFHPAHRMTRAECLQLRERCFAIIRDLEGVVSSEEPVDYAVPHLHLVHHGPYAAVGWILENDAELPAVPLWNLVYHDSLLLPWPAGAKSGGFGIPPGHCGAAHAALNGGMPYLSLEPSRSEIARAQRICKLHERVALEEMVDHKFLNAKGAKQRTAFGDGTVVTADVATGKWTMSRT